MIGKKIKAYTYPSSKTPETLTILDKVRGVYVHNFLDPQGNLIEGKLSRVVTIDYYLCKKENGETIHIKPSSIERVIEEREKPPVAY